MRRFLIALAAVALLVGLPLAPSSAAGMSAGSVWIGGHPYAGGSWWVRTSGWPTGTTFNYRWYLDGNPQPFATTSSDTYTVPKAYFGHTVTILVTGSVAPNSATTRLGPLRVQGENPLAGDQWNPPDGPYQALWDGQTWVGKDGTIYAPPAIQNRPRVSWLNGPDDTRSSSISTQISLQLRMLHYYIAASQNGNPNALVHLGIFGIYSIQGGEGRLHTPLNSTEVANYRTWITAVAQALGRTRVVFVLEPDLAITTNPTTASSSTRQGLTKWAAKVLSANPNATIYISAGDADWLTPSRAATLLVASGIQYARGFELGDTHYSTVGSDTLYAVSVAKALTSLGYPGKHFVADTSDNGRGFSFGQDPSRAVCASKSSPGPCVTLGVPPTWQVIDTKMPLTATQKFYALRLEDADLWVGRPWEKDQAWPFLPARAAALAASSPYA